MVLDSSDFLWGLNIAEFIIIIINKKNCKAKA